jgi:hypothetical protein
VAQLVNVQETGKAIERLGYPTDTNTLFSAERRHLIPSSPEIVALARHDLFSILTIMGYRHLVYINPVNSRFNRNLGGISSELETSNYSVGTDMVS